MIACGTCGIPDERDCRCDWPACEDRFDPVPTSGVLLKAVRTLRSTAGDLVIAGDVRGWNLAVIARLVGKLTVVAREHAQ